MTPLDYYSRHHCALFPLPKGQKNPVGIVSSFAADCSADPQVWERWAAANPDCNWGVVAGPSRLIIVDVDVAEVGREAAWAAWCAWCATAALTPPTPHIQSARGGWHFYFRLPDDAPALRQVALVGPAPGFKKAIVDVRVGNGFTIAGGSYYDGTAKGESSGAYTFLTDAAPLPAPPALIAALARATAPPRITKPGDRDREDVAALVAWLAERGSLDAYEDWVALGMALKLEYGDDGLDLWQLATWPDALALADDKWPSFATEPDADSVTLGTFLKRAHDLGWRGSIRRTAGAMFSGADVSAAPAPSQASQGVPMLAGQEALTEIGEPVLREFLAATSDAPLRPTNLDYPTLPDACSGHGLYKPLCEAIDRILACAESPKTYRKESVVDPLALLHLVHQDTADAIGRRIRTLGRALSETRVKQRALNFEDRVRRKFAPQADWQTSVKTGEIESDNSDNVAVFLGVIGAELRWNAWMERPEIRCAQPDDIDIHWPAWTKVDDTIIAKLRARATRTGTRFRPALEFLRDMMLTIAHRSSHDPVREKIDALQAQWDGVPRLAIWLSATCGVPCDLYHQAVARNIVGGIVRRARHPGCKHDETAILIGPQGTRKSTLARILALHDDWFSDSVAFDGSPQNVVPQLFGKLVIELAELDGMQRREVQHVKRFLSAQTDSVTLKYRAFSSDHPRRCLFIGTSNEDAPLMDATGNRRFLPVRISMEIDTDWLAGNIGQVIGEAAHKESAGDVFAIPRELLAVAAEHQESARAESDIETRLNDWFAPTAALGPLTWITAADLVDLSERAGWRNGGANAARGIGMKKLGFRSELIPVGGKKTRSWVRGPTTAQAEVSRLGVRYQVGSDAHGRPRVSIAAPATQTDATVLPFAGRAPR